MIRHNSGNPTIAVGSLLTIFSKRVIPKPSDLIDPRQPFGASLLKYSDINGLVKILYLTCIVSTSLYSIFFDLLIKQTAL